jgi:hypothetical protein
VTLPESEDFGDNSASWGGGGWFGPPHREFLFFASFSLIKLYLPYFLEQFHGRKGKKARNYAASHFVQEKTTQIFVISFQTLPQKIKILGIPFPTILQKRKIL